MNSHPMRRSRQEITDPAGLEEILAAASVCRIGFAAAGEPYVVPMNFGWAREEGILTVYLHCAGDGRKLPLLRSGSRVCFQTDLPEELRPAEEPCDWGIRFRSLVGWGIPRELTGSEEKTPGLNRIMEKYSGRTFVFDEAQLARTRVFRIPLTEVTAKRSSV